jgi:hypothetical protein
MLPSLVVKSPKAIGFWYDLAVNYFANLSLALRHEKTCRDGESRQVFF